MTPGTAKSESLQPSVRLAHFSDVHICLNKYPFGMRDIFSKRTAGWVNLRVLGRAHRFRHADLAIRALARDLEARKPDHRVFSGDASCLGFDEEFVAASEILGADGRFPGIAVPGNHDHLLGRTVRGGMFEHRFSPWQEGIRLDKAVYPFAQRIGPLWLVAVNSSKPNFLPWDATGAVGNDQLDRLTRLLDQLGDGMRVLVTHYPVHLPYHHEAGDGFPFAIICAGSATQTGKWSYGEYTIQGNVLLAQRRLYSPDDDLYIPSDSFTLNLPFGLETAAATAK